MVRTGKTLPEKTASLVVTVAYLYVNQEVEE
jgi:hypothetical protein